LEKTIKISLIIITTSIIALKINLKMITKSIKKSKIMKTKILITTIALGVFTISTIQAQEKKHDNMKHEHMDMAKDKAMYSCSMHPEVKIDKPGECPKCGMELKMTEKKKDSLKVMKSKMNMMQNKMAKTFTCPMHPDAKSDKPDDCSKCGMKMIEKKMDMKKKKENKQNEHKH
jgi:heavy metal-binding protein